MKQSIVYFLFFLISSCRTNRGLVNDDYFLLRFRENFFYANHNIVQDYSMRIPKGGNLTKGNYDLTGDYHIEYRIAYLDSSILYIGNSNWSGSKLNTVNRVEAGIIGINKKNENDTLHFEGIQGNGRYWKELFLGEIIVGYVNVRFEKKARFDSVLLSVKPYETSKPSN